MDFYVLAFTDAPAPPRRADGRRYAGVRVGRVLAVGERRTSIPDRTDGELRRQYAQVIEVAQSVDAVLPARFGSLIPSRDLRRVMRQHRSAFSTALDLVRSRVQMTIRIVDRTPTMAVRAVTSGREYLERKRREVTAPPLSRALSRLLSRLAPMVVREQISYRAGGVTAVYHLIDRTAVNPYLAVTRRSRLGVQVSGPWPPFAFTPDVL